jgi:hypothetical protein
MKNFEVIDHKTKKKIGDFLNVGLNPRHEMVVWYLSNDGLIKSAYFENIELKQELDVGMC